MREKGENGKEGRDGGKSPSVRVRDGSEGECKTKQKPQIDSSSSRARRDGGGDGWKIFLLSPMHYSEAFTDPLLDTEILT